MSQKNQIIPHSSYFPILESVRQGGLSLWLNRVSLLRLGLIPVAATFITLSIISSLEKNALSPLILAVMQIPADLVIGLYTALIIMIIMAAPRQKIPRNGAPVAFPIDLREKKNILIAAAIAHSLVSYLFMGWFTAVNHFTRPITGRINEAVPDIGIDVIVVMAVIGLGGLYAIRINLLPVLIIGDIDVKSFFKKYHMFGLSLPVLFIKAACTFAMGLIFFIPLTMIGMPTIEEGVKQFSPVQDTLYNLISAMMAVGIYAWMYASFAYGVRLMIESHKTLNQDV